MADEYTPSMEEVRDLFKTGESLFGETFDQHYRGAPVPDYGARFDRWLAVHDAEIRRAQAEKDAAVLDIEPGTSASYEFRRGFFAAREVFKLKISSATPSPEEGNWEYAWEADESIRSLMVPRGPKIMRDEQIDTPENLARFPKGRRIRRRPAGPWTTAPEQLSDVATLSPETEQETE